MPDLEQATQYTDNKELVPTIYSGRRVLALNWFPTPGIVRPTIETISSFTGGTGLCAVRLVSFSRSEAALRSSDPRGDERMAIVGRFPGGRPLRRRRAQPLGN